MAKYVVQQAMTYFVEAIVDADSQKMALELSKQGDITFDDGNATTDDPRYKILGKIEPFDRKIGFKDIDEN